MSPFQAAFLQCNPPPRTPRAAHTSRPRLPPSVRPPARPSGHSPLLFQLQTQALLLPGRLLLLCFRFTGALPLHAAFGALVPPVLAEPELEGKRKKKKKMKEERRAKRIVIEALALIMFTGVSLSLSEKFR